MVYMTNKLKDGYVTLYNISTQRNRGSNREEIQTKLKTLRYETLYIRDRDYRYFNPNEKTVEQLKIKTYYTIDEDMYKKCNHMYIHTPYHNKMYRVAHKDYDVHGGYIYWYLQESVGVNPIDTDPVEPSEYEYPTLEINSQQEDEETQEYIKKLEQFKK